MAKLQSRGATMKPEDFIYNQVYRGCLRAGCNEYLSKNTAVEALRRYKNNQFTTPSKLVDELIKHAKKQKIKQKRK